MYMLNLYICLEISSLAMKGMWSKGEGNDCFFLHSGSFNSLLRELVAEFTLTDNPSNTTTSLLRSFCHYDDSVLLGSWLKETDHKFIEDQVCAIESSIP